MNIQVSYLATALSAEVQTVTFLARQAVLWLSGLRRLSPQSFSRMQRLVLFVLFVKSIAVILHRSTFKSESGVTFAVELGCTADGWAHFIFKSLISEEWSDVSPSRQEERQESDRNLDVNHYSSSTLPMQWALRPPITSEGLKESSSMTVVVVDANLLQTVESDFVFFSLVLGSGSNRLFVSHSSSSFDSPSFSFTFPLLPLGNLKSTLLKARSGNLNVKHSRWKPLMDDPVWVQDLVLSRGCRFEEAYRQWGRGFSAIVNPMAALW